MTGIQLQQGMQYLLIRTMPHVPERRISPIFPYRIRTTRAASTAMPPHSSAIPRHHAAVSYGWWINSRLYHIAIPT